MQLIRPVKKGKKQTQHPAKRNKWNKSNRNSSRKWHANSKAMRRPQPTRKPKRVLSPSIYHKYRWGARQTVKILRRLTKKLGRTLLRATHPRRTRASSVFTRSPRLQQKVRNRLIRRLTRAWRRGRLLLRVAAAAHRARRERKERIERICAEFGIGQQRRQAKRFARRTARALKTHAITYPRLRALIIKRRRKNRRRLRLRRPRRRVKFGPRFLRRNATVALKRKLIARAKLRRSRRKAKKSVHLKRWLVTAEKQHFHSATTTEYRRAQKRNQFSAKVRPTLDRVFYRKLFVARASSDRSPRQYSKRRNARRHLQLPTARAVLNSRTGTTKRKQKQTHQLRAVRLFLSKGSARATHSRLAAAERLAFLLKHYPEKSEVKFKRKEIKDPVFFTPREVKARLPWPSGTAELQEEIRKEAALEARLRASRPRYVQAEAGSDSLEDRALTLRPLRGSVLVPYKRKRVRRKAFDRGPRLRRRNSLTTPQGRFSVKKRLLAYLTPMKGVRRRRVRAQLAAYHIARRAQQLAKRQAKNKLKNQSKQPGKDQPKKQLKGHPKQQSANQFRQQPKPRRRRLSRRIQRMSLREFDQRYPRQDRQSQKHSFLEFILAPVRKGGKPRKGLRPAELKALRKGFGGKIPSTGQRTVNRQAAAVLKRYADDKRKYLAKLKAQNTVQLKLKQRKSSQLANQSKSHATQLTKSRKAGKRTLRALKTLRRKRLRTRARRLTLAQLKQLSVRHAIKRAIRSRKRRLRARITRRKAFRRFGIKRAAQVPSLLIEEGDEKYELVYVRRQALRLRRRRDRKRRSKLKHRLKSPGYRGYLKRRARRLHRRKKRQIRRVDKRGRAWITRKVRPRLVTPKQLALLANARKKAAVRARRLRRHRELMQLKRSRAMGRTRKHTRNNKRNKRQKGRRRQCSLRTHHLRFISPKQNRTMPGPATLIHSRRRILALAGEPTKEFMRSPFTWPSRGLVRPKRWRVARPLKRWEVKMVRKRLEFERKFPRFARKQRTPLRTSRLYPAISKQQQAPAKSRQLNLKVKRRSRRKLTPHWRSPTYQSPVLRRLRWKLRRKLRRRAQRQARQLRPRRKVKRGVRLKHLRRRLSRTIPRFKHRFKYLAVGAEWLGDTEAGFDKKARRSLQLVRGRTDTVMQHETHKKQARISSTKRAVRYAQQFILPQNIFYVKVQFVLETEDEEEEEVAAPVTAATPALSAAAASVKTEKVVVVTAKKQVVAVVASNVGFTKTSSTSMNKPLNMQKGSIARKYSTGARSRTILVPGVATALRLPRTAAPKHSINDSLQVTQRLPKAVQVFYVPRATTPCCWTIVDRPQIDTAPKELLDEQMLKDIAAYEKLWAESDWIDRVGCHVIRTALAARPYILAWVAAWIWIKLHG